MKTKLSSLFILIGISVAYVINDTTALNSTTIERTLNNSVTSCESGKDPIACIKLKLVQSLEPYSYKNDFQINDFAEIRSNGLLYEGQRIAHAGDPFINYLRSHDVIMKFPGANTNVMISGRGIDSNELDVKFEFAKNEAENVKGRRNKMKRVIIPIMVLILLKAMTVIPLALGVLGLKAFNSLQLGFVSFLISAGLAIFQICKKLAVDHYPPHVVAHPHWDGRQMNNITEEIHSLVYKDSAK